MQCVDNQYCRYSLSNLLNRTALLVFFKMNQDQIQAYMALLRTLLRKFCPRIAETLESQVCFELIYYLFFFCFVFEKIQKQKKNTKQKNKNTKQNIFSK